MNRISSVKSSVAEIQTEKSKTSMQPEKSKTSLQPEKLKISLQNSSHPSEKLISTPSNKVSGPTEALRMFMNKKQ